MGKLTKSLRYPVYVDLWILQANIENLHNRLWRYYIQRIRQCYKKCHKTVQILSISWYIIPYKFSFVCFFLFKSASLFSSHIVRVRLMILALFMTRDFRFNFIEVIYYLAQVWKQGKVKYDPAKFYNHKEAVERESWLETSLCKVHFIFI